jgi:hypothetical protein
MTREPDGTPADEAGEASETAAIIADLRRRLRNPRILRHPLVRNELSRLDLQLIGQTSGTGSHPGRHRSGVLRPGAGTSQSAGDLAGLDLKPDPLAATTAKEFMDALRRYRAWSGFPSLRKMADRSGQAFVHSTMHTAMQNDALPKLDLVKAIIRGCEGSPDDMDAFVTAWRRIGAARSGARTSDPGLLPAPVAEPGLSSS